MRNDHVVRAGGGTRTTFLRVLCTAFVVLGALSACAPAPQARPLKLGMNAWPGYELLYVAEHLGYLREEGVAVQFIDYPSLSDARKAFENGQLDGFTSTLVEVLSVRHSVEREPVITLLTDYSNGPDVVIARREFADLAALRGHRVGVEIETVSLYLLARGLQKVGLGLDSIKIVPIKQGSLAAAFARGEIDAMVSYPPVAYGVARRADAHVVFSSKELPGELLDVLSVERSVFESRPQDIAALQRAWKKTVAYYRDHPQATLEIIAARENVPINAVADTVAGLVVLGSSEQLGLLGSTPANRRVSTLLRQIEATMMSAGMLSQEARHDCCLPRLTVPGNETVDLASRQ